MSFRLLNIGRAIVNCQKRDVTKNYHIVNLAKVRKVVNLASFICLLNRDKRIDFDQFTKSTMTD